MSQYIHFIKLSAAILTQGGLTKHLLVTLLCAGILIPLTALANTDAKITTVDINKQPFKAESVRWWLSAKPNNRYSLECAHASCTTWLIHSHRHQSITISAHSSIINSTDPYCSKLYHGEALLLPNIQTLEIVMKYTRTACRSQRTLTK